MEISKMSVTILGMIATIQTIARAAYIATHPEPTFEADNKFDAEEYIAEWEAEESHGFAIPVVLAIIIMSAVIGLVILFH